MKHFTSKALLCFAMSFFFLFLFTQTAFAQKGAGKKSRAPADAKGQPIIHVDEESFSFGEVMEGTQVEHDFIVKNTGKAVLNIERVRVG